MHFGEQLPAEQAKSIPPKDRMNERVMVQRALMTRDPEGGVEWALKYAATFGRLFDTDESFYDLAKRAHQENDPNLLTQIQERLDAERPH